MYATGALSPVWGIYLSECGCQKEIGLRWGETFPPCAKCGPTTWQLLRRYRASEEQPPEAGPQR
jgi:hypothetical protein